MFRLSTKARELRAGSRVRRIVDGFKERPTVLRGETLLVAGIQRREGQEGGGTETKGRELVVEDLRAWERG